MCTNRGRDVRPVYIMTRSTALLRCLAYWSRKIAYSRLLYKHKMQENNRRKNTFVSAMPRKRFNASPAIMI